MHDSIKIFAQLKRETLQVESLPSRSGCRRQTTNASIHLGLQERKKQVSQTKTKFKSLVTRLYIDHFKDTYRQNQSLHLNLTLNNLR